MIELILTAFAEGMEPWTTPDWVAITHVVRDGKEFDTRLHFSPPKPAPTAFTTATPSALSARFATSPRAAGRSTAPRVPRS